MSNVHVRYNTETLMALKHVSNCATMTTSLFKMHTHGSTKQCNTSFQSLFLLRLPQSGLLPHTFMNYPGGNIVFFLLAYIIYFQFVAHTFVAANRYSAISLTHYKVLKVVNVYASHIIAVKSMFSIKMWAGGRFKMLLALLALLPLPGVISRFMSKATVVEIGAGAYAVVFTDAWVFAVSASVT